MIKTSLVFLSAAMTIPVWAVDVAPPADQIASAVLAAPQESRKDAAVLG